MEESGLGSAFPEPALRANSLFQLSNKWRQQWGEWARVCAPHPPKVWSNIYLVPKDRRMLIWEPPDPLPGNCRANTETTAFKPSPISHASVPSAYSPALRNQHHHLNTSVLPEKAFRGANGADELPGIRMHEK